MAAVLASDALFGAVEVAADQFAEEYPKYCAAREANAKTYEALQEAFKEKYGKGKYFDGCFEFKGKWLWSDDKNECIPDLLKEIKVLKDSPDVPEGLKAAVACVDAASNPVGAATQFLKGDVVGKGCALPKKTEAEATVNGQAMEWSDPKKNRR